MKLSWLTATTAAFIVAGVTAASAQTRNPWPVPATGFFASIIVIDNGQIVGQEPDLFVRSQIQRDNSLRSGGGS